MKGLLLFFVACLVSLIASFLGLIASTHAAFGHQELGPVGAILWIIMIPAALIGTLIGYWIGRPRAPAHHGTTAVLFSAAVSSAVLAAMPAWIFAGLSKASMPSGSDVYVPAPDYKAWANLDPGTETAVIEQPLTVKVLHTAGPWVRVERASLRADQLHFDSAPSADDPRVMSAPVIASEPADCVRVLGKGPEPNTVSLAFQRQGLGCDVTVSVTTAHDGQVQTTHMPLVEVR